MKYVVFDLGGVVFADGKSDVIKSLAKTEGYEEKVIEDLLTSQASFDLRGGKMSSEDFWNWAQEELPEGYDAELIRKSWYDSYVLDRSVLEIIKELHGKIPLAVFSGNIKDRVEYLDKKYNFRKYFDKEIYSFDHALNKQNPEFTDILLKKLQANPGEIVLIDDSEKASKNTKDKGVPVIIYSPDKVENLRESLNELGIKINVKPNRKVNAEIPITTRSASPNRKPTRTISGVAPVAVMLPPRPCDHGVCTYCPSLDVPQSYTPLSPVVMRAREVAYSGKTQVVKRLEAYKSMGHTSEKVEIIIMGGTFLQYDRDFQFQFVKELYDGLNGFDSKTLEEAKKANETAEHRCVALCIETRPDHCSDREIKDILSWGTTRVEMGVQALDDESYKFTNRGHKVEDVVGATMRLRDAGFKIGYHLMPGVSWNDIEKDIRLFKLVFDDDRFKPDQIKIYPCQVLKGSALEQLYYDGKYKPYTKDETAEILTTCLSLTPRYCRAMRIMREIPPAYLVAGIVNIDLRKVVEEEIRRKKIPIKEIRFREVGFALRDKRDVDPDYEIKTTEYTAGDGKEYFIEAVNKDDILFGLLRLRISDKGAMVRELHVYGPTLKLHVKDREKYQHKGLGKELMALAEKMAKENGKDLIKVISGVGVREYYYNMGYALDEASVYVEKKL